MAYRARMQQYFERISKQRAYARSQGGFKERVLELTPPVRTCPEEVPEITPAERTSILVMNRSDASTPVHQILHIQIKAENGCIDAMTDHQFESFEALDSVHVAMVCFNPLSPVLSSEWVPRDTKEEKEFQDYKTAVTKHLRQLVRRENLEVTFKVQREVGKGGFFFRSRGGFESRVCPNRSTSMDVHIECV